MKISLKFLLFFGLVTFLFYISWSPQNKKTLGAQSQKKNIFAPPKSGRVPSAVRSIMVKKKIPFSDKLNHRLSHKKSHPKKRTPNSLPSPSIYFSGDESFQFKGVRYLVSDSLGAMANNKFDSAMGKAVFSRYGYAFFPHTFSDENRDSAVIRVVQNSDTGQLGILTGHILVQTKTEGRVNNNAFEMTLISSQPQIDLYTYRPNDPGELHSLVRKLNKSNAFKHVELEIIEGGAHEK